MPRIDLRDPFGMSYCITTRRETILRTWFDEVLPHTFIKGRPVDDFEFMWPRISVHPMWAWDSGQDRPDWPTDSRALGRLHEFPAMNGEEGLKALAEIRQRLEKEISQ